MKGNGLGVDSRMGGQLDPVSRAHPTVARKGIDRYTE